MSSIKLFEEKKVRSFYDEVNEKWYFSIVDVIEVLTESINPTDYLKNFVNEIQSLETSYGQIAPDCNSK